MTRQPFERFLAILGTLLYIGVMIPIWQGVSAQRDMWPLWYAA
jgi:hypothetical protein